MGVTNLIPVAAPFSLCFFFFLLFFFGLSLFPIRHFSFLNPNPRSCNSVSKKSTSHRRTSLCIASSSSQKKKLGVSPSPSCHLLPQTKLNNSSQQQQQHSWLPPVIVTIEFYHHSRSSSSVVSFSANRVTSSGLDQ